MLAFLIIVVRVLPLVQGRMVRVFNGGTGCGTTKPIQLTTNTNTTEACTLIAIFSNDLGETSTEHQIHFS